MELARLAWPDVRDALRGRAVGLLPVGSVENHGPHLPLGTDLMTATHVARRAAESSGFLLCPAIPIGLSHEHRQFAGTLWVQRSTFDAYVRDVARSLCAHGLRCLVSVNGHSGNSEAPADVCRTLRRERCYAFVFSWWVAIGDVVRNVCEMAPDHAGDMETSAMLFVDGELVRMDRADEAEGAPTWGRRVEGVQTAFDTIDFTLSGTTGKPTAANSEERERLITEACARLLAFGRWLEGRSEEELAEKPLAQ